jgi:hypothetical protein
MVIPASGSAAMRFYNFAIVIEEDPEEYSPRLPGCFSNGRTTGEARQHGQSDPSSTSPPCSPTAMTVRPGRPLLPALRAPTDPARRDTDSQGPTDHPNEWLTGND